MIEIQVRIDERLTRWIRRAVVLAAPVAAMAIASAAVGVPKQFVAGEVLKAADLDANFGDLETRVAALEGAAPGQWTAYAPVIMSGPATLTTTTKAQYRVVGDTLEIWFSTQIGTCPNANVLTWSLPAGFAVDQTKLPDATTPTGAVIVYNTGTGALFTTAAATQTGQPFFAVENATTGGGLPCISNRIIKGTYSIPIQ